jgi:hypothetical protein
MKNIKNDIKHTIFTHADLLAERHADYVNEFVTRANDELYLILAELLALHERIESLPDKEKLIKQMRKKLREEYKIKTQANTKPSSLMVRYVTRSSRKTAHVYGRVLEVAVSEGITSATLVDYIKAKGGIDRVRKAVDSAETKQIQNKQEKLLHEKFTVHLQQKSTLGTVQFNQITSMNLPHSSDVVFTHLLCTFNHRSNQHEIVSVLYPNSTLEEQALSTQLTLLDVASQSNDHGKFYQLCKEHGLNMDITHRWMKSNNTPTANHALNLVQTIKNTKLGKPELTPVALKLAA